MLGETQMTAATQTRTAPDGAPNASTDPRWSAVVARDRAFDGEFYYSVRTTGIYCRPSCGARRANPQNVAFHATTTEAEAAGFRPCRRCRPGAESAEAERNARILEACRRIETSEEAPSLATLAAGAGLSPHHFHRVFKSVTGVTPREYLAGLRARRVREELPNSETVTEAIYDAGFNSGGRFYAQSNAMLGMTPTAYRAGGTDVEIRFAVGECSLGSFLVARSPLGICAILLGDDPGGLVRDLQDRFPRANLVGGDAGFEQEAAAAVGLIERPADGLSLPLDIRGTAFQQRVWRALQEIPAGATASYSDIATRIGSPKSVRAVAQACAANALAVAIPCHRVVRLDGDLSGYRWGVERKRALLDREKAAA
jgi:AraC family transcriptional regulator of adaptative response/methylated-DNA-[protein]-cysteine methyltransferase